MKKILLLLLVFQSATICTIAQNVGIGTPVPESKLHVVDTINNADGSSGAFINVHNATLTAPNGVLSGIRFRLDGVNAGLNSRYKGGILFEKTGSFGVGKLHFLTNALGDNSSITTANARMTIASDGLVGIGNSSPSLSQLEINGISNRSFLTVRNGVDQPGISQSAYFSNPTLSFNLYVANAYRFLGPGYGANIQYNPTSGVLSFSSSTTKGDPGDVSFFNSSSLNLDSSGNVGVGTSAPKAKFHVTTGMVIGTSTTVPATGYILSVNGKIMTEEVRVQMDANWPDYVFDNKYKLRPLKEVEQFIAAKKHLPGIPSAKQVAEDGLHLGDMQKRIMEKVEELTLYVIQLNKENQQLKQEVETLRKIVENK